MSPRSGRATPEELRAWREDGFFVREHVFTAGEVAALRDAAEAAASRAALEIGDAPGYAIDDHRYVEGATATVQLEQAPGSRTLRVLEPFHHLDPRLDALVDDPRLTEPVRDLVGSEALALFTTKLNFKRPREGSRFRWHQDSPYWAHVCPHVERCPNVLVALDDADEDNGCLRVVRGSHRRGMLPGLEREGRLGPLFTDPRYFDERAAVPAVLRAGSVLFFSPHTVHGSEPNRSDRARRALLFTYQPDGFPLFKRPEEVRSVRPAPAAGGAPGSGRRAQPGAPAAGSQDSGW